MTNNIGDIGQQEVTCSICGRDLAGDPGRDFVLSYPNFVCTTCDGRAVTADGDVPKYVSAYDDGDNPVFIEGVKCWRRYRFGGFITMRDAHNCSTLHEFYERHRAT